MKLGSRLVPVVVCSAAMLALLTPLAAAQNVPDLSGYWSHNVSHFMAPDSGPGPVVALPGESFLYRADRARGLPGVDYWAGDFRNPILQPWAAEAVKAHGDSGRATGNAQDELLQMCKMVGVPHVLLLREALVFLQETSTVTMLYQRDQQVRRVAMGAQHPANVPLTPYGHSVGWYEGDTLVVDTVGLKNMGAIDYYGTPHTDRLHVVERYRVVDDGRVLEARFTIDDSGAFTTTWTGIQRYNRARQTAMDEIRCAENNKDAKNREFPIPRDDTPDF